MTAQSPDSFWHWGDVPRITPKEPERKVLQRAENALAEVDARFDRTWLPLDDERGRDARFSPGWWLLPGLLIGLLCWLLFGYVVWQIVMGLDGLVDWAAGIGTRT